MSVTDPDVPDPLNDPRTTQADPGARGQGDDLAAAGDDPASTGDDGAAADRGTADEAGGDLTGDGPGGAPAGALEVDDLTGGAAADIPPV